VIGLLRDEGEVILLYDLQLLLHYPFYLGYSPLVVLIEVHEGSCILYCDDEKLEDAD
jgi:hypothetical protein